MRDTLEFYLSKWTNPVRKAVIHDALNVLDMYGEVGTSTAIALRLENSPAYTTQENMDAIDSALTDGLRNVLLALNLNITGSVSDLANILRGLHTITTWEDHDTIINEIDLGGDPFEIIMELLELVDLEASIAWQHCVTFETIIADGLLERIRSVHQSILANEDAIPDPVDAQKETRNELLRQFILKHPECIAYKHLKDGFAPGLPIHFLLQLSRHDLLIMDDTQALVIGASIISLVLFSDTPEDKIITVARELVEDIWIDDRLIKAIIAAIDHLGMTAVKG